MAWVRMDDRRAMHPKLCDAGFAARGLDEAAIELCASDETDGFIADKRLKHLGAVHGETWRGIERLAQILCSPDVDRWRRDDERGGYWIKDYLDYNPSHAELEAKRAADRGRKRSGRGKESPQIPKGVREDSKRNPSGLRKESAAGAPGRDGTGGIQEETRAPDDLLGSHAHRLTVLAFEQPVKPVLRSSGEPFPAVLGIFRRLLEAGVSINDLQAAIVSGIDVWSTAGIQTAIARSKPPRNGRDPNANQAAIRAATDRLRAVEVHR